MMRDQWSGAVFSVQLRRRHLRTRDVKEDGTPASDTKPLVTKGEVVDKITTGEDGKGESNKSLYIGKYIRRD